MSSETIVDANKRYPDVFVAVALLAGTIFSMTTTTTSGVAAAQTTENSNNSNSNNNTNNCQDNNLAGNMTTM